MGKNVCLSLLSLFLCILLLGSCGRKRFELEISLSGAQGGGLEMVYSAEGTKFGVVSLYLPIREGKWKGPLPVARESVVFLYTDRSDSPFFFVADRGDNVSIKGDYADLFSWEASGNKVNEDLNKWRKENRDALISHNPGKINGAVGKWVSAHRDALSSAVLMLVCFDRTKAPEQFDKLWNSLDRKVRESGLIESLGASQKLASYDGKGAKTASRKFFSSGDTLVTVDPKDNPYTLYFFWEREGEHSSSAARVRDALRSFGSRVCVVDICMREDTVGWRRRIESDSTSGWVNVWCPGAERSAELESFHIPRPLYYVLTDSAGNTLYRGVKPEDLTSRIK